MTLKLPKTNNRIISMFIFLGLVAVCFFAVVILTIRPVQHIESVGELEGFDLSSRLAYIMPSVFERFPEALYSPDDFAAGITAADAGWDGENPSYATYRLVLDNLTEGVVYGISGYSATHAMTLWVNGVILAQAGTPGSSLENMTAGTNYFAAYFVAGAEPAEIVIQRSSFVLVHGGRLNPLYIGEQHLITEMNTLAHFRISLIVGITLMAALVNLGIFVFFKSRTRFIFFSLVCLLISLRTLGIDNRLIATLFPNMAWHVDYIIGYLSTSGFIIFIVLYVNSMFQNMVKRFITLGVVIGLSLHSIFILVTPSTVYSYLQIPYNVFTMASSTAVLFNVAWLMVKDRSMRHSERVLVLIGTAVNVSLGLIEGIVRSMNPQVPQNLTQIGALVFMFLNIIALALYFDRAEKELAAANDERSRLEADEIRLNSEKEALVRLGQMRTDLIADVTHETTTPLSVLSVYAELIAKELKSKNISGQVISDLDTISEEAIRIAGLIDELNKHAMETDSRLHKVRLDLAEVIGGTARLYTPIIERTGSALVVDIQETLPEVYASRDEITQVLVNLLQNARNHTENGTVSIEAFADDNFVIVTVADTGVGVSPAIMPRIFERGVSGEDLRMNTGSGLGLALCKEIIDAHNDEIRIESGKDRGELREERGELEFGTRVVFTLPVFRGDL